MEKISGLVEAGNGTSNPRASFCGGAICYRAGGGRYRLACTSDAIPGEALCSSCRVVEKDELQRDLERCQRSKGRDDHKRGGYG